MEQLGSPVGRALWQWYASNKQGGTWPPKEAFRPEHLPARVLPHVGLVDVEREPFRVFYRLVGTAIRASAVLPALRARRGSTGRTAATVNPAHRARKAATVRTVWASMT